MNNVAAAPASMMTATVAAAGIVFPAVAPTMTRTAVIAKSALAAPVGPLAPAAKAVLRTSAPTMTKIAPPNAINAPTESAWTIKANAPVNAMTVKMAIA